MLIQNIDNKGTKAYFYGKPENEKTMLFLPGFPKYPGITKYIEYFNEKHYNVLVPMYPGTFESSGTFCIDSSIKCAKKSLDFLNKGEITNIITGEKVKISNNNIDLLGVSYGTLILGLLTNNIKLDKYNIKKAIFISMLWDMEKHKNNKKYIENADLVYKIMKEIFPKSYRFKNKELFFKRIKGNQTLGEKIEKNITITGFENKVHNNIKKVIFHGTSDEITPISMAEIFKENSDNTELYKIEGGHSSKIFKKPELKELINKIL